MKLYIYNQNCASKGEVSARDAETDEEREDNGDLHCWGEGTEEELIAQALDRLAHRYDNRAGGAGDDYAWTCARSVLLYLDGPDVQYDPNRHAYFPIPEEEEEETE